MESIDVYVRKEDGNDSGDCDVWDDTVLIEAYNRAVEAAKKKVRQQMSICNGVSENDKQDYHCKDKNEMKKEKAPKKPRDGNKWKVGDHCRAVYSVDGIEYEATVTGVLPEGRFIVKYCGYGNEETVKGKDLKSSAGEHTRSMQEQVASGHVNSNSNVSDSCAENNEDVCNFGNMPWGQSVPGVPVVPPPPAFNLTSQFNQENESDALSAMLLSWYMTGYHTGYYQGLMLAKKRPNKGSNHKK
ncbi:survival motor neuron [Lycorma delicatula]|uniref:survival motor neuron n=1 Tax=Lycorma delicatula TaxID=130591 RepID=UPI003F50FBE1